MITKYGNPTWARAADPGSQMPPLTRGAVSSVATRWGMAKNKALAVYPPPRAREKRTPRASWNGGRGAYPGPLRALSARHGDGLGVASIWSHDIDLRVTPLFDPSVPRPDARLVHF